MSVTYTQPTYAENAMVYCLGNLSCSRSSICLFYTLVIYISYMHKSDIIALSP